MKISIIQFSVQNFKAFKDKVTFSMSARKNDDHTFKVNGENLLKTSFIYGPNASGKTSLFEAVLNFRQTVLLSANNDSKLPYNNYKAHKKDTDEPIVFELAFTLDSETYQYNFSFLKDHIVTENLSRITTTGSEIELITRTLQDIKLGDSFKSLNILLDKTRKDSLFLSQAAQFNDTFSLYMLQAFNTINVISGITYEKYINFTIDKFKNDDEYRKKILGYLKMADFCITNGRSDEVDTPLLDITDDVSGLSIKKTMQKANKLVLEHPVYDNSGTHVGKFDLLFDEESAGTKKFLSTLGPIIDTLAEGKVLLIDEFDNSLHPLLTKFIVDLFESNEINVNNAQLITTTHDTSLLAYKDQFIKDQFWFTEKDEQGAAKLFSLGEFAIRNDTEFADKYLEGRFGALPYIKSLKK